MDLVNKAILNIRSDLSNKFGRRYCKSKKTHGRRFNVYYIHEPENKYGLEVCSWYIKPELDKVADYIRNYYGIGDEHIKKFDDTNLVYSNLTEDNLLKINALLKITGGY